MTFPSHAPTASDARAADVTGRPNPMRSSGRFSIRLALAVAIAGATIGTWLGHSTPRDLEVHASWAAAPAWKTVVDPHALRTALDEGNGRAAVIVVLETTDAVDDFRSWSDPEAVRAHRERVDAIVAPMLERLATTDTVVRHRFTNFAGVSIEASRETLARLAKHPAVATIEPVRRLEAHTLQGLSLIGADDAHTAAHRGAGVSIAIADTGIDTSHAQLGGATSTGSVSSDPIDDATRASRRVVIGGADFVDSTRRPIDLDGHGTRVAGITAGRPSADGTFAGGAAPEAALHALKIADSIDEGAASDALLAAWDWTLTHRDDDPAQPIVAVNTSFGLADTNATGDALSPAATRAAAMLVDAGIIPVASAGNAGHTDSIAWPASISHVLAVGAVYDEPLTALRYCLDPNGGRDLSGHAPHADDCEHACEDTAPSPDRVPCYSNASSALSLLAPSHDAYTLDANGGFTCCFGGTSVSSAYVAGSIALVQSAWRERTGTLLSANDLRARLERTGTPITDAKSGVTTPRLDVARAIETIAPDNDDCAHASAVVDGRFAFSTFGATTAESDEPSALATAAFDAIGADVWFCYNAPRTGFAELSLCGSSFDTRVAVYAGCECPDGEPIAFNDDFCGPQSEIVFPIVEGEFYLVRVGGFENAQGDGLFELRSGDGADLVLDKTIDKEHARPGDAVTYRVLLRNDGPSRATGITIAERMPADLEIVDATVTVGRFDAKNGAWDLDALDVNANAMLEIRARVVDEPQALVAVNLARVAALDQIDPDPANDEDGEPLDLAGVTADLAVTKVVDDATPDETDTVVFTVTLTNNGPDTATGVQVTDLLPSGVTYVSDTPSQGTYASGTGIWDVGSLTNAASATLAITATVDAGTAGTTITNTATVTALDQTDPTPANDSDSAALTVRSADLAILKTVDDATPSEGDTITYTVTVTNDGPDDATGTAVLDTLPSGVTYVSDTPSQGSYDDGTGVWIVGGLTNGASATLMITATVDAGTEGDTITNTATRTAGTPGDSNAANDSASADIVVAAADIAVTKVVDIPTPDEGQAVEFTITVTNDGPENATGIMVNDVLPSGLTFVSATVSQGTYTQGTGVWDVGALTNGSSATLTLDATVDMGTAGQTIVNTATRTASEPGDPNAANDSDAASVMIVSADLGLTKIVDVANPNVGDTVTFTVTLVNNGPDDATGVQVTDLLPTELTLVSGTPTVGTYTPGTGVWNVGAIANGANETLTIVATVDAGTAGQTITNTATVTAVIEGDPVAGNDTASASVTVQGADLGIQKLVDDATPDEGQTVNFTLILTNGGPDAATNVAVMDLLPSGLTFSTATPSQGTYTPGTGVWAVGTLASGNVATLSLAATVDAGTAGQMITNTAAISAADQEDPNAANDSASVNLVVRSADLAITKVVDDPIVIEGQMITFTLTVSNAGPDNATGVAVLDLLPSGLTFVSSNPSQGTYTAGTGAWVVGGLANGAIATLGITATVDVGTQGTTITNTASIANGNPVDPNPANDVASQDVIVPLPLANDDCIDAIAVSEGMTAFNNLGATTDGPDEPGLCNFLGNTQVQSDVWFVYTPSCTGQATVSLCGSAYDTKMAIYDGDTCPTVASAIACNEDFCSRQSQITFSAVTGNPYLIRIGGFLGEQGTGTMEITCVPENDDCVDATPVGDGSFTFGNVGATTDGPDEPLLCEENGETQVESDVWYLYTASCDGNATVSLCGSAFNTKIAVYDGNVCPTVGSAIACNDDFCATESQVTFPVMTGGAYLLRIGGFMGDQGTGTATITCSPVALNDDCADAFPITDGITPFDNIGATTDGPDEPGICNLLGDTQVRSDVWFEYVATCTGEVTVSLCGSDFDTKVAIYAGATCPTVASAIACNEDFCGRQSQVTFTGTLGNTYLIRVGGFGGEQGTGLLDVSCNPSNDDCANAIPVTDGMIPFSNVGATTDGPDEPGECDFLGDTQVQSDVWYRYTATCSGEATVSLCGSSYDTKIAIYNGATCPTVAAAVACNEDFCGRQSEVTFLVLQGQQYLIRIGGFQGEQGDGVMDISCRPAPPSDNCVNAIQVFEGTFAFDTFDATTDGPDEPGSCDFLGYTHIESDIWYEYTPTCTGEVTISLCGSGYDTKMAVYDGFVCPPTQAPLACNDDTCECGGAGCTLDSLVTFLAIAGESYLVRIGGFEGEQGAGTLTITCDPIPLNDNCTAATAVGEGVFAFDNIGATTDGPDEPSLCLSGGESQIESDVWFVYTAGCNGTATISLCGSNFDTRMAIYNGSVCPVGESAIACNDDFCNRQSEISLSVVAGRDYLVRIGGFEGEQGEGTLTISCDGVPIGQCQGQDADVDVIRVNGSTGSGAGYVVPVSFAGPITLEIDGPPAGPGKFVVHMNAGVPDAGSIIALPFGLGSACFDFLITRNGMPVSVWNNIGKTSKVGASNYFGTMIANPNNAPTIFESQPTGDPVNLPIGSMFTLQGIITNFEASSPRNVSITNAVIMNVQ